MRALGFIILGILLVDHELIEARRIKRGTEGEALPNESFKLNSSSSSSSSISGNLSTLKDAGSTKSSIADGATRTLAEPTLPIHSVPLSTATNTPSTGSLANGMIITVASPVTSQESIPLRFPLAKAEDLLSESCSRLRHLSEPLLRRKHSKFFEDHQNLRRTLGELEQRKHKRRSCRKPSNLEISKEEEVLVLPFSEFEAWGRDMPERRHRSEIVEHSYDESPSTFEESILGEGTMPEPSPLMSLAHFLFGKHPHQREPHYKAPPPSYENDDLALVVDKSGSKLANFIHNMRTAGFVNPRSNQLEMAASNVDDEELEIRCPIHHGSGGNSYGVCTCNIVKNKHESDR